MSRPALLMPVLFRGEDIVALTPPELADATVRASLDGTTFVPIGRATEDGRLTLGSTGDRADGRRRVSVEIAGVCVDVEFEVTHDLFVKGRQRFGRPEVIAHRGGKSDAPENTLAAFRIALERADRCEFDVRLTCDDELVVMHDPTVDRTTDGTGRIADLTLAEIRRLGTGERAPPTLHEVLDELGSDARLQIHPKLEHERWRDGALLRRLAEALHDYNCEDRCTVLATKAGTLDVLEHNPDLHLDIDIHAGPAIGAIARFGAEEFRRAGHRLKTSGMYLEDSRLVREAHDHGIPLVCWARDSSDRAVERLLRLGVDSVMTDYPERMGPITDRLLALAGK